jgi:hypothetical protein
MDACEQELEKQIASTIMVMLFTAWICFGIQIMLYVCQVLLHREIYAPLYEISSYLLDPGMDIYFCKLY